MNWRGRPLTSHEIVVQTIAATTTRAGLTVTAELDTASYPKGIKTRQADHRPSKRRRQPRRVEHTNARQERRSLGAAGGCRTVCNAASSRVSLGRLAAKGRNFCLYAPTRGEVASEKP